MNKEIKQCNRCGDFSDVGKWKFSKWFCKCCLEYSNISKNDNFGSKKRGNLRG